ncbi:hypothetical protein VNO77_16705 [Canavalia gladiata]|uniref:DEUBAD domain-containing protein n=1 Tax=Canavalia gladiata TaxID=3824 RepID=A0AAN9LL56_CANGL
MSSLSLPSNSFSSNPKPSSLSLCVASHFSILLLLTYTRSACYNLLSLFPTSTIFAGGVGLSNTKAKAFDRKGRSSHGFLEGIALTSTESFMPCPIHAPLSCGFGDSECLDLFTELSYNLDSFPLCLGENIPSCLPMAADHRRKRLNGVSMITYGSPEQHRTKTKNLGLVRSDLTVKSHISVEWDGNHQRVVAKWEQIGISWRQMRPFVNFVHNAHSVLADVLAIPQEIFGLDSLSEVLSYEVWNTHLLANERNFLMQFLPSDVEPNQVIQELLSGDNIHFGNPFLKWQDLNFIFSLGASLCAGDLHPDMIVNKEQHLRSEKKAYYSQLHNYHKDMIRFLIKLKERWENCKDPEKEMVQKIWRSKNDVEKRTLSHINGFGVYNGNLRTASELCSWAPEEKLHSDYRISSMGQGNELQRRSSTRGFITAYVCFSTIPHNFNSMVLDKGFNEGKPLPRNLLVSSDYLFKVGARSKKGEKLHKLNLHSSDSDKYMPYIKISKKQHQLLKSMKLSCKNIQSSTFNCVMGNLDNTHVQPLEVFVEEEWKKLHQHWLQLVNRDITAAYTKWTERLIQKHAMGNSLALEMKDKSKPQIGVCSSVSFSKVLIISWQELCLSCISFMYCGRSLVLPLPLSNKNQGSGLGIRRRVTVLMISLAWKMIKILFLDPLRISLCILIICGVDELNHLSMDSEKDGLSKSNNASQNKTEYSQSMNSQDVPNNKGAPFSSNGHAWQAVEIPPSYCDSVVTHKYKVTGLSLVNPQVNEEQQGQLLERQPDDDPCSSYQSQDQIDLLQPPFKQKYVNFYHHERKRAGPDFQTSNNDNISSNGGGYLIPRQDPLSPVNITDRSINAPLLGEPSRSLGNAGDFVGHNWFSAGQARGGRN